MVIRSRVQAGPSSSDKFVRDTHQLGKSFILLVLQIRSPTRMSKTCRMSLEGGGGWGGQEEPDSTHLFWNINCYPFILKLDLTVRADKSTFFFMCNSLPCLQRITRCSDFWANIIFEWKFGFSKKKSIVSRSLYSTQTHLYIPQVICAVPLLWKQ